MTKNIELPERPHEFKKDTIKTPEGGEVSYCPERGGIITSIKLRGKEILYLDEETFQNVEVNTRGGIPVLFPNAGPIKSSEFPDLKQHGFARGANWLAQKEGTGFIQTLTADNDMKRIFPYNFKLSVGGRFNKDGSFSLTQLVENIEKEKAMPVSMGLHPYFKVPHDAKRDIKFNFEGGNLIEENIEKWANGEAFSIDNPKVKDSTAMMEVFIPALGVLIIDASIEYKKIWIWSLPGKDFVCIEPVMRNIGGLVDDPEKVRPGSTLSASININLKE